MANYSYVAVDAGGMENRGSLEVADQYEALKRIKEMGLFPTRLLESRPAPPAKLKASRGTVKRARFQRGRIKPRILSAFTRQLATLLEAGLPLLRGLRLLEEQAEDSKLRRVIGQMGEAIENGSGFAEALALQPRVFDRLYVNLVKAGEIGGMTELALKRLADYLERNQKIRGKVKSAMFYPAAVLTVAIGVVTLLLVFILPRFQEIFQGLMNGMPLPAFTRFVVGISNAIRGHIVLIAPGALGCWMGLWLIRRTVRGRFLFDRAKLSLPIFGPVFRKLAISRFSRTLGTLVSNGVPILQALNIVKETAGNVVVGQVIATMHDRVKEGDPLAPTLKTSGVFPAMVAGMVDVGEQTGALPDMLIKIADVYDEEVDNSVGAMTSLLEPVMIVFLAVVVGSIVIAMFLPLIVAVDLGGGFNGPGDGEFRGRL